MGQLDGRCAADGPVERQQPVTAEHGEHAIEIGDVERERQQLAGPDAASDPLTAILDRYEPQQHRPQHGPLRRVRSSNRPSAVSPMTPLTPPIAR